MIEGLLMGFTALSLFAMGWLACYLDENPLVPSERETRERRKKRRAFLESLPRHPQADVAVWELPTNKLRRFR